uniref:CopG-like RHH_1 or ribbon-helix-helix domain-containing protein, RHH_5 n=1 Tax=Candidatus Kentrum sp. LFY TaxID=2126342 RepID=A0A450WT11_9GAMM|nr:MAG: hypothetical protein BECKLFY1418C_GA0070996_10697 [Candidatus Kentron sp. LFY]
MPQERNESKPTESIPTMTRLDPELYERVKRLAENSDRSLSRTVARLVENGLQHREEQLQRVA